jgi:UV DNA damage endonuclease
MTVEGNLDCVSSILQFNAKHNILFFRITSDLVPFASHPVNMFDWKECFRPKFEEIGDFIRKHNMRISMHPDQFTLINSISKDIFKRSRKELAYHSDILDLMKLDASAKIQVHVGGVYGDKKKSMGRFVKRFYELEDRIRRRLVIENDDKLYNLQDCIRISMKTELPVLFDVFHHRINGTGETVNRALQRASKTWKKKTDDIPVVDYSSKKNRCFTSPAR